MQQMSGHVHIAGLTMRGYGLQHMKPLLASPALPKLGRLDAARRQMTYGSDSNQGNFVRLCKGGLRAVAGHGQMQLIASPNADRHEGPNARSTRHTSRLIQMYSSEASSCNCERTAA